MKMRDTRIILLMCAIVAIILLPTIHFHKNSPVVKFTEMKAAVESYAQNLDILEKHGANQKWIVITSINSMTPAIEQMATFEDYHVVVIMDTASPTVYHANENIVYLNIKEQQRLGFNIYDHVPFNSYTRKNIGYLYAIKNGARIIYDTDDDNFLEFQPRARNTRMDELASCTGTDHLALNPYAAFGKPAIWPRGFPLEHVSLECTGRGSHRTSNALSLTNASIWQGLADLDPDVDAIFRMTHTDQLKRVIFTRRPPVFIPHDAFAPFNSQNTMFFYESFWALYLPSSVSFRVTDIWRGYFVQKLLRYTDSYLAFVGPTVEQDRNAHNYAADYIQEQQMYAQTTNLLRFLHEWEPSIAMRFFDIMIELAQDMADENFWGQREVFAIRAWIHDLRRLGYEEPRIVQYTHSNETRKKPETFDLCAAPFDGKKIIRRVEQWWADAEKNAPATFAIQMDTRGFGAYMYDILFSSSYLLQANRSIAYNQNDHSAYDSSFCEKYRGLLCFFDAPRTDYDESNLTACENNSIHDEQFCDVLSTYGYLRGAIAGEENVMLTKTGIIPRTLHAAGWSSAHWFGFLTQQLTHPNEKMTIEIQRVKERLKWTANEQCVAAHIRRSDKKIEYTAHNYPATFLYVDEVRRLKIEHPDITSVFLTSDNREVLNEFAQILYNYVPDVRIMINMHQKRFNGAECGEKIGACPDRNGITDQDEKREWAVGSMLDFYLLSSCPYLVGSFSSFFTKAAAYRMIGSPDILQEQNAEDHFRSIDDDDTLQTWTPQYTVLFDVEIK